MISMFLCIVRVWIRPTAPSCNTPHALPQPPAPLQPRQAHLRPQHLRRTLRHHRHPPRGNVCVQGNPISLLCHCQCRCQCVWAASHVSSVSFRTNGSGEYVTTMFWMDILCQLVTFGGDCPLISMLHLKEAMGSLFSLKVSPAPTQWENIHHHHTPSSNKWPVSLPVLSLSNSPWLWLQGTDIGCSLNQSWIKVIPRV